jgi:phospholipase B1
LIYSSLTIESYKKELDDLVDAYQKGLQNLVDSGRYDTRDDFTVVDQPFFSQTQIPVNGF